ncbi:hypothetical protein M1N44_01145 [Dehalococcoidia bacterium]|nr:hypothetical protein [Dehalococcoidia bacterium]
MARGIIFTQIEAIKNTARHLTVLHCYGVLHHNLIKEEQAAKAGVGMNDILIPLCRQVQRVYLWQYQPFRTGRRFSESAR